MEDYKKNYEKALARAKGMYAQGMMPERLEYIFPELKESEDEKIKKALIQWVNDFPGTIWRGHYKKDVLTWLEKQGEQKPINIDLEDAKKEFNNILKDKVSFETLKTLLETWWQNTLTIINMKPVEQKPFEENKQEGDKIVTNPDGTHFNISQLERVSKPEDVNGEKIRKSLMQYFKDIAENGYSEWVNNLNPHEVITYLEKQKPVEWSEKDENMYLDIESLIHSYRTGSYEHELSSWLKSLKYRILSQKQEWSEEDRTHYNKCLQYLESISPRKEDIEWFKSLRPQSTWKPSIEQMRELHKVFDNESDGWEDSVIESLYNDLKTL